jgi:phage tail-like protein
MGLLQKTSSVTPAKDTTPLPIDSLDEFPIPSYQFSIEMAGKTVALFQTISGMETTRKVEPLDVGGMNDYSLEFPGHVSFSHITFAVGLTSSDFFWRWMMSGSLDGYALSKNFTLVQRRPNPDLSKDPAIFPIVKRWDFKNAFPVSWKISDLNLDDSTKIVIETLELSFDYFELGK